MKKLFISILLLAMLPFAAVEAQDARGRVTSTIVADALNQLPAEDAGLYNRLMGELAATGSEGVEMIASMLKPAAEGVNNSPMEYALNGVAWYVTESGNASLRDGVREGLRNAADKCGDPTTKAFLLTVLERCATAEDAGYFAALLGGACACDPARNRADGAVAHAGAERKRPEPRASGTYRLV